MKTLLQKKTLLKRVNAEKEFIKKVALKPKRFLSNVQRGLAYQKIGETPNHLLHQTHKKVPQKSGIKLEKTLMSSGSVTTLDGYWKDKYENFFGVAIPRVRIHRDKNAINKAEQYQAHSYAQGIDIYLGKDVAPIDTLEGQMTLAHEITHVLQQKYLDMSSSQGMVDPSVELEQKAKGIEGIVKFRRGLDQSAYELIKKRELLPFKSYQVVPMFGGSRFLSDRVIQRWGWNPLQGVGEWIGDKIYDNRKEIKAVVNRGYKQAKSIGGTFLESGGAILDSGLAGIKYAGSGYTSLYAEGAGLLGYNKIANKYRNVTNTLQQSAKYDIDDASNHLWKAGKHGKNVVSQSITGVTLHSDKDISNTKGMIETFDPSWKKDNKYNKSINGFINNRIGETFSGINELSGGFFNYKAGGWQDKIGDGLNSAGDFFSYMDKDLSNKNPKGAWDTFRGTSYSILKGVAKNLAIDRGKDTADKISKGNYLGVGEDIWANTNPFNMATNAIEGYVSGSIDASEKYGLINADDGKKYRDYNSKSFKVIGTVNNFIGAGQRKLTRKSSSIKLLDNTFLDLKGLEGNRKSFNLDDKKSPIQRKIDSRYPIQRWGWNPLKGVGEWIGEKLYDNRKEITSAVNMGYKQVKSIGGSLLEAGGTILDTGLAGGKYIASGYTSMYAEGAGLLGYNKTASKYRNVANTLKQSGKYDLDSASGHLLKSGKYGANFFSRTIGGKALHSDKDIANTKGMIETFDPSWKKDYKYNKSVNGYINKRIGKTFSGINELSGGFFDYKAGGWQDKVGDGLSSAGDFFSYMDDDLSNKKGFRGGMYTVLKGVTNNLAIDRGKASSDKLSKGNYLGVIGDIWANTNPFNMATNALEGGVSGSIDNVVKHNLISKADGKKYKDFNSTSFKVIGTVNNLKGAKGSKLGAGTSLELKGLEGNRKSFNLDDKSPIQRKIDSRYPVQRLSWGGVWNATKNVGSSLYHSAGTLVDGVKSVAKLSASGYTGLVAEGADLLGYGKKANFLRGVSHNLQSSASDDLNDATKHFAKSGKYGNNAIGQLVNDKNLFSQQNIDKTVGARDLHYSRNQHNFHPKNEQEAIDLGWSRLSDKKAIYHRMGKGNENNHKYVSPDGHDEGVFYGEGSKNKEKPVKNVVNEATYNYFSPNGISAIGHVATDVLPYYLWGNSKKDPTTFSERLTASYSGDPEKYKSPIQRKIESRYDAPIQRWSLKGIWNSTKNIASGVGKGIVSGAKSVGSFVSNTGTKIAKKWNNSGVGKFTKKYGKDILTTGLHTLSAVGKITAGVATAVGTGLFTGGAGFVAGGVMIAGGLADINKVTKDVNKIYLKSQGQSNAQAERNKQGILGLGGFKNAEKFVENNKYMRAGSTLLDYSSGILTAGTALHQAGGFFSSAKTGMNYGTKTLSTVSKRLASNYYKNPNMVKGVSQLAKNSIKAAKWNYAKGALKAVSGASGFVTKPIKLYQDVKKQSSVQRKVDNQYESFADKMNLIDIKPKDNDIKYAKSDRITPNIEAGISSNSGNSVQTTNHNLDELSMKIFRQLKQEISLEYVRGGR